jgi:hypothetical protein
MDNHGYEIEEFANHLLFGHEISESESAISFQSKGVV